jgi:hypothetical protein
LLPNPETAHEACGRTRRAVPAYRHRIESTAIPRLLFDACGNPAKNAEKTLH